MWGAKITLDRDLMNRVKQHATDSGYSSVEEFVTHILERELAAAEDVEPDEALKQRLQGLGYLS
jgi:hypothetical protein